MTSVPATASDDDSHAYFNPADPTARWHLEPERGTTPIGQTFSERFRAAVAADPDRERAAADLAELDRIDALFAAAPDPADFAPAWAESSASWSVDPDAGTLFTTHTLDVPLTPRRANLAVSIDREDTWRDGKHEPGEPHIAAWVNEGTTLDNEAAMALALALATASGRLAYIAGRRPSRGGAR
ncbi:hypothetical protein V5H98_15220 [Georgenia sp. M64]|uniref:hypothetical protein n=1 Tax=Georgenia sp. M64 TaxID=3120520 RepID=UPI0030E5F580